MGFISILLDILAILAIVIFGSFIVVVIADLILCLFDDHEGIIFRRRKKDEKMTEEETVVKKDDIVVYSNQQNCDQNVANNEHIDKKEVIDGNIVTEVDFNKAMEEQQALSGKKSLKADQRPVSNELEPKQNDDIFWNIDEDKEFTKLLDDVIVEAKKSDDNQKVIIEDKKQDDETAKALEELKALKEQQQKEIEEFKQMKEDFAREKEEQLALLKDNLDKAKAEEIEKIRQEAIREQERLEAEKNKLEEDKIKEVVVEDNREPIIKETIVKDEEELNKLKLKNLMRMNTRLSKIIRDTERLQFQKQKDMQKDQLERQKLQLKEQEERQKEAEKRAEIQRQNRERLLKQTESLKKRDEINRKLKEISFKAGKYKLDSAKVTIKKEPNDVNEHQVVEETVTTIEETIPGTDTIIKTVEKSPLKASVKPVFAKEYYEQKLIELDNELKDAEKELRINKSEYVPLTRIYKAYDRDSEKLRKKEILVAKQKVALYGINSIKIDSNKKAKLDENLQVLSELKDSVTHCEEVIKKNKDRYPVLEKNNQLILKQIDRINDDIKVCEKAISYYNKKKD